MKRKTFKYYIYGFIAIVCLILVFISSSRKEKQNYRGPSAVKIAERIRFESKKSIEHAQDFGRRLKFDETPESVYSHGAISIVKNPDFEGVNEKPKSMMQKMREMAKSRKSKIAPIHLEAKDFKKKIFISTDVMKQSVKSSSVPGLNEDETVSKITMISAPVDYKLFQNNETWKAFTSSHQGKFPDINFATENAVILVSLSDFPSGIFKIENVIKKSKEIIIKYKVNPLIMAVGNKPDTHNYYTAFAISKADLPIRLIQIP
jgi:hypothetical protein